MKRGDALCAISVSYTHLRAIQLLNKLDAENRLATPTEQRVLADYVGWGGLSEFFKEDNPHYTELKAVLSDEEYALSLIHICRFPCKPD